MSVIENQGAGKGCCCCIGHALKKPVDDRITKNHFNGMHRAKELKVQNTMRRDLAADS